ncbi:MAG: di-heme oxidoredictase family protein [Candidatus Polarisedimenticolia bacterium]
MRSLPRAVLLFTVAAVLGSIACCRKVPQPGDPIAGLTKEQRKQFDLGRTEFDRTFTPETGLGPIFNSVSCAECHESPVTGGAGDEIEIHVSASQADGSCDLLLSKGGPVIQQATTPALRAALGIDREPEPAEATGRAQRTTPDVFGFGLLEAVPEATLLKLADPDDKDGDGISGRVNRFPDGRVGRFGRKALLPSLKEFNDGAFTIEQGITNPASLDEGTIGGTPIPAEVDPVPEPEIDQRAIDATDAFVRFLAAPAPLKLSSQATRGRGLFEKAGCDRCHVPVLKTGDSPIEALRNKDVAAYTDLLLHDMGPELADICFGMATAAEFRTEPLMGLRFSEDIEEGEPRFLHDGRAGSIEEAIRLHGGEAAPSRDRFLALSEKDRKALLAFLRSL